MSKADRTVPALDAASFERLLLDPDVPDETLRPYLVQHQIDTDPFRPVVTANPARVKAPETEAAVALASLNGISRWRRQQRYRQKLPGWTGLRIVSEGDSWFQYPFLLTDVIDWLSPIYAIYSLDAAGDLLSDMVQQGELMTAVIQEKPDVILLSGGGNDLLGGSRLSQAVLAFETGRTAQNYLGDSFETNLRLAISNYERLFARLADIAPNTPVLCHVYDYAIPAQGPWLGRPLADIGIVDRSLQRAIVRAIVDRFHAALIKLIERFACVHVIDTRGAVSDEHWHDELHPDDSGYGVVAQLFATEIARVTKTDAPKLTTEAAVLESARLEGPDEAERLLVHLDAYPDDALLREIGRRETLAQAGDLKQEPVAVYPSSVTAAFPLLQGDGLGILAVAVGKIFAVSEPGDAGLEHELQGSRVALFRYLIAVLTRSSLREDQATLTAALLARHSDRDVRKARRRWEAVLPPH